MPQKSQRPANQPTGFQIRQLRDDPSQPAADQSAATTDNFEHLGELPRGYGVDTIFLVAQEPHWLFTYWDIDISRHPGGATYLRYSLASGTPEGEIEVPFETRNWYIPVQHADCEYSVEIGYYRADEWKVIARSVTVRTPAMGLSSSDDFTFATIPFHLSFQRLIDNLETSLRSGDNLAQTLSHLQRSGDFSALGLLPAPDTLTTEQHFALLAILIGPDLLAELSSSSLSSAELHSRLLTHLTERLSSGSSAASGFGAAENAPSSEAFLSSWSHEQLTSWVQGVVSSWTSLISGVSSWETLSSESSSGLLVAKSGLGLSSWSSESVGAFASSGSLTSWTAESITSWLAGIESSGATLTSWLQAAESSGFPLTLSSWLQGVQSSWGQAATSSWAAAATSSWTEAALTSWTNAEFSSSWGGSDTVSSFSSPVGGRDFFLHVNAEVIFYGGTHPSAQVTIDGKPINLSPDGTFHYHFVFPNDAYEIPITARSPDGVETRGAILRFERETSRTGHVTDTAQPPLDAPMGGRRQP